MPNSGWNSGSEQLLPEGKPTDIAREMIYEMLERFPISDEQGALNAFAVQSMAEVQEDDARTVEQVLGFAEYLAMIEFYYLSIDDDRRRAAGLPRLGIPQMEEVDGILGNNADIQKTNFDFWARYIFHELDDEYFINFSDLTALSEGELALLFSQVQEYLSHMAYIDRARFKIAAYRNILELVRRGGHDLTTDNLIAANAIIIGMIPQYILRYVHALRRAYSNLLQIFFYAIKEAYLLILCHFLVQDN